MEARIELAGWFKRMVVTQDAVVKGVIHLDIGPPLIELVCCDAEGRKAKRSGLTRVTFHYVGKTEDGRPWFRAE